MGLHRRVNATMTANDTNDLHRLTSELERYRNRGLARLILIARRSYAKFKLIFVEWRATRSLAVAAAQIHGVSRRRQFFHFVRLVLRYGYSPEDYYRFRMCAAPDLAAYFLPLRTNIIV